MHVSELREIVNHIQTILWREAGEWNQDKEWNPDTIEEVARTLDAHGLRPDGEEG